METIPKRSASRGFGKAIPVRALCGNTEATKKKERERTEVAAEEATEMAQEGDGGHDELQDYQEEPGVPFGGNLHQPKDAAFFHARNALVHHQQPEEDPGESHAALAPELATR